MSNFTHTLIRVERYFIGFLYCSIFFKTVNSPMNGKIQSYYAPALDNAYVYSEPADTLSPFKERMKCHSGREVLSLQESKAQDT
jgi:hypothetical protein